MEMKSNYTPRQTALCVALTAILGITSPIVSAATLNATADYNVGNGPANDSQGPSATSVDILDSHTGPTGDVFYHTYGNATGTFGARVSGTGNFDITSTFSFSEDYTNNSGISQNYFFDFSIIPGGISTDILSGGLPGDSLFTSYDIDVTLTTSSGTTTIFDSAASIATDMVGSVFTATGTSLGGSLSSGNNEYNWSTFTDSLALGSFADGELFSINYDLTTTASGVFTDPLAANCFGGEGGIGLDDHIVGDGGEGGGGCSSIARSGDPFGLNGGNTFSLNSVPSSVPEPSALWLVGTGLVGIAGLRRKKKA